MKIITCAPLPPPNGGIANWYNIVSEIAQKKGYTFININTSPRKSMDSRSIFYRVVVQGFRMLSQRNELSKIIRKNKDAKSAHITTSGQLAIVRDIMFLHLLRAKGVKSIYHIHFGRIPEMCENNTIEWRLMKKALSLASEIIAIDGKTYDVLEQNFDKNKVHYIPNPVNKVCAETSEESKNILFLGNVLKAKGVEELLTSFEKLSKEFSDWKLTIAGFCEPDYEVYLKNNFSFENVEMTGFLLHDDAMEKLSQSEFLVLPSYTEGFPNVVIEAMMCEKAVVATNVGAIEDILSGGCGIVISPQNESELYEAMKELITNGNKRAEMGQKGKEKAIACYETDIVFEKYVSLWETN